MNTRPLLSPILDVVAATAIELAGRRERARSPLAWALGGFAAGAAVAFLVAPSSGRELRARLLREARERTAPDSETRLTRGRSEDVIERAPQTAHIVGEARDIFGPSEA